MHLLRSIHPLHTPYAWNTILPGTKRAESFWREPLYKSVMELRSTLSVIEWIFRYYGYFILVSFLKMKHFIQEIGPPKLHVLYSVFPQMRRNQTPSLKVIHSDKFISYIRKYALYFRCYFQSQGWTKNQKENHQKLNLWILTRTSLLKR